MIMTLQERLDGLKAQREQLMANINAVIGGIQVIEQLIAEQKAETSDTAEPAKS